MSGSVDAVIRVQLPSSGLLRHRRRRKGCLVSTLDPCTTSRKRKRGESMDAAAMSKVDIMSQHEEPLDRLTAQGYAPDNAEAGPSRRPITMAPPPMLKSRKRPAQLKLASTSTSTTAPRRSFSDQPGIRSVPASPLPPQSAQDAVPQKPLVSIDLRESLRGAPRRRPSVLFPLRTRALPALRIPMKAGPSPIDVASPQPPSIWQDPSEHTLSGNGSSLQHARSSYAAGAIEVLPGLFLGDEFNARDEAWLAANNITTILNVSKEIDRRQDQQHERPFEKSVDSDLSSGVHSLRLSDDVTTPTVLSYRHAALHDAEDRAQGTIDESHAAQTARPSSFCLRSHSSTPNLLASMARDAAQSTDESGSDMTTSDDGKSFGTEDTSDLSDSSPSLLDPDTLDTHIASIDRAKLSPPDSALLTPLGSSFSKHSPDTAATSTSSSSSNGWNVALPNDAVSMLLSPAPEAGRSWPIRYVQLPWTHDQTDLASGTSKGGFLTGCAIIADALGIDRGSGRQAEIGAEEQTSSRRGGILVHCQCGVSRSATLVIAFVMQAAALQHDFAQTQSLTGMHDCYGMVKELSSSISPNISLIYQLVEWERYLSGQVSLHESAESARARSAGGQNTPAAEGPAAGDRRWGREVMDEEAWMRMRAEEERREQEEEQEQVRLSPPVATPSARSRSSSESSFVLGNDAAQQKKASSTDGVAARRKKSAPRLTLTDSAVAGADRALRLGKAGGSDAAPPLPALQQPRIASLHGTDNSSGESAASTAAASSPGGGNGKVFGALLQSAAERRMKHKRAFSTDVPDWPTVPPTAVAAALTAAVGPNAGSGHGTSGSAAAEAQK